MFYLISSIICFVLIIINLYYFIKSRGENIINGMAACISLIYALISLAKYLRLYI